MYIYENKISVPLHQGEEQSVLLRSSQRYYYPNQVQGLEEPIPQSQPPSSRKSTDVVTWTDWLDQNPSKGVRRYVPSSVENAIEHAVIVEKGSAIRPSSLPMNLVQSAAMESAPEPAVEPGLREKLNVLEKQILLEALSRARGIKRQAAAMLHVDPRNLPYLLRKHDLGEHRNYQPSLW